MPLVASDHALLRYMERFHGIDVARFREELLMLAAPIHAAGAQHGSVGELWFVIKNDVVVTITPNRPKLHMKNDRENVNGSAERAPRPPWQARKRRRFR